MKHFFVLPFALVALAMTGRAQRDDITSSLQRWSRDFVAGRIELDKPGVADRKPYLAPSLRNEVRRKEYYTRIEEAEGLMDVVLKRAKKEDLDLLLSAIEDSLAKKGGRPWEVRGEITRLRIVALAALGDPKYGASVQDAVVARLEGGIDESKPSGGGEPVLTCKKADFAAALIPVLERYTHPAVRGLLERFMKIDDGGIRVAAASGLAATGHGPSVVEVAKALTGSKFPDDIGALASAMRKLVRAEKVKPEDKDLKFALNVVLERLHSLEDWRSRLALVPLTREIRSRGSISVLLDLLEEGNQALAKKSKKSPFSGTLLKAVHEALADLTGFYADIREPEKWRSWWDGVKDTFVLAPAKALLEAQKGSTVASEFFGIPVTGNNVYFVVDISGSMAWQFDTTTVTANEGKPLKEGSRMDRAKEELLKAVDKLAPDSRFNVCVFSDHVKEWKNTLVEANPKNKKMLGVYVERLNPGGGTMLYDGLDKALKVKFEAKKDDAYESYVDEIFLLSDGSPTLGSITNTEEILRIVREWNQGAQVRIHAIFIGNEAVDRANSRGRPTKLPGNMGAEEFMKKLAEQNNGRFVIPQK
ncbi:MAG: VWA domain-containing protein [Planctomycetes bacterium]|nr:VWA domain-containing protein [Planctomycetota bacterium]